MALYSSPRPLTYGYVSASDKNDLPFNVASAAQATTYQFLNAALLPIDPFYFLLKNALASEEKVATADDHFIEGTAHPSIASHKLLSTSNANNIGYSPVPILIESGSLFTKEFLYFQPEAEIFPSFDKYYTSSTSQNLFAVITAKRSEISRGIPIQQKSKFSSAVYTRTIGDTPTESSLLKVDDSDFESIKISSFDIKIREMLTSVSIISDVIFDRDTWYNGKFDGHNVGNNVAVGYTNAKNAYGQSYTPSDRYSWSFGSIFFVMSIGDLSTKLTPSEYGLREIQYNYGDPTMIKLRGWKYDIYDGDTSTVALSGRVSNMLYKNGQTNYVYETETPAKVYGRQIYTYFVKNLEEGKCIKLDYKNGGIEISVDFNRNGNCCSCQEIV